MENRTILVTGGSGFIGSNLVRYWLKKYPGDRVLNADCGTYAARPQWISEFLEENPDAVHRYRRLPVDIRSRYATDRIMKAHRPDAVIHLAAESHVCRSISGPEDFVYTNIVGTFNLLQSFLELHGKDSKSRFLHVSTDEVFGELPFDESEKFDELTSYKPRSPYAASKASSDHIVASYHHTYGLNTVVTNCTNNFGPNQHEEKLIPRTIQRILAKKPVIVHGKGDHVRDWIHVWDHCRAIDAAFHYADPGSRFCVGGENERTNLDVVKDVYLNLRALVKEDPGVEIEFTNDRPTDDTRYAVRTDRLRELGWAPSPDYHGNLRSTIEWYLGNM